ncbi:MAG: SIMPL domain-containing protein [Candidatus Portnoybacteria bacterium]|nr:SIMPL domain-containing protein [Candidatus Portnoybacteria bacterium]
METISTQVQKNPYLTAVIVGGLFFLAGQYIASQPQRAQKEAELNREITVQGEGEVVAKPDIAKITLSVETAVLPTSQAATDALGEQAQRVLDAIEKADVAEKDMQTTNLAVNPVYDYTNNRQTVRGYQGTESVHVTVRKPDEAGAVVAAATAAGATQAGGISLEIDKPDDLKVEAQEKAIEQAREKAETLAKALGVSLGKVKTFSVSDFPQAFPLYAAESKAIGVGGDVIAPPVAVGENTIKASVTVTYELK